MTIDSQFQRISINLNPEDFHTHGFCNKKKD